MMKKINLKPQIVQAGAGTGKTTKLIETIFDLYNFFKTNQKKEPNFIVCTFTIKATQELKERLNKEAINKKDWHFLDYMRSPSFFVSTIDGILAKFLRTYAHHCSLSSDFEIKTSSDKDESIIFLLEKHLFEKHPNLLEKMPFSDLKSIFYFYIKNKQTYQNISLFSDSDFKEFCKQKESFLKDASIKEQKEFEKKYKVEAFQADHFTSIFHDFKIAADEFFEDYLKYKKNLNHLTIEDILLFSLDLLRSYPSVAKDFSHQWDYWFIDEYQDTSWIQEQIFEKITQFKNVFCVGDPKQSIYLFRNADPKVFERRLKDPQMQKQNLLTNYRSHSELIHFFNDFFKDTKSFTCFKIPELKNKNLKKHKPTFKHRLTFLNYSDKENACHLIYKQIKDLCLQGAKWSDITILSTKNDSLSSIKNFLNEKNINTLSYNASHFIKNRLILDSLFLLKFLINPYDNNNLIALLRAPYFYLQDFKLMDICLDYNQSIKQKKETPSLWSFIKIYSSHSQVKKLQEYLDLKSHFSIFKIFERALLERAFIDLAHYQDPSGCSESNLWQLIYKLQNSKFCLETFYSLIEEDEDSLQEAPSFFNNEAIELMTVHKSKGLEFKHVIFCDFSINQSSNKNNNSESNLCAFDSKNTKMTFAVPIKNREDIKIKNYGHHQIVSEKQKENYDEKNRLYYVAFTRAQESLSLLIPIEKPQVNSWLKGQIFFDDFKNNNHNNNHTFDLKEGEHKRKNYKILISKKIEAKGDKSLSKNHSKVPIIKPYNFKTKSPIQEEELKSSKDFEKSFLTKSQTFDSQTSTKKQKMTYSHQNEKENQTKNKKSYQNENKKVIKIQMKNTVLKTIAGNHLHLYCKKLSSQSLQSVLNEVENNFLTNQNQLEIKKALEYVYNLKELDMKFFLKQGYSEWPFKWKQGSCILQGQIDLWGFYKDDIYVFDYKSSFSQKVEKQLIFYSWVLNQMHQPKNIMMIAMYPFEKDFNSKKYSPEHEKEVKTWLQQYT